MSHAKMPLAAIGMIAAHIYLERVKEYSRGQLDYQIPGTQGTTYGERVAYISATEAHRLARAVEETAPRNEAQP